MAAPQEVFLHRLGESVTAGTFVKLTLGRYRGADATLRNLHVRPVTLRAGPHLRLSIRDNGHGLSKGVMERIFEPFACKKISGKNSGLELFTVQEIAHAHEGAVTVESTLGEGTVFHLYFPVPA